MTSRPRPSPVRAAALCGLVLSILSHGLRAQAPAVSADTVTSFLSLEALAKQLAAKPHAPPPAKLDPFFEGLKYDDHRQIRFNEDKAIFGGKDSKTFSVQFFHPGWMFKKNVGIHDLDLVKAIPVPYSKELFDYGKLKMPEKTQFPDGFAGFRVLAPLDFLGRRFEFMTFMGASYFRAVTPELGYGISARGISVNTIGGEPEEFPDFTHFWLMRPAAGDKYFKVLALLEGPSLTGAFQLDTMPGKVTDTFVKGTIFMRKPVKSLGLAPFSSMFWYGENSHPKPYDFRPEVHDSDGLQIEIEGGPAIWRPLDVSKDLRLSLMQVEKLKGFGLAERDRDFLHFQDLEAMYHRRPAVWVRPIKGFDKGTITLVEIPTGEETWDNIVAYYQPEKIPSTPEEPLRFEYQLSWLEEHLPGMLARVIATRRGFAMDSDDHLYVLDFAKGVLEPPPPQDWLPDVEVTLSGGEAKLLDKRVMHNTQTGGWRAFFKLDIAEKTNLLELTCELLKDKKAISERWMYQWRR